MHARAAPLAPGLGSTIFGPGERQAAARRNRESGLAAAREDGGEQAA